MITGFNTDIEHDGVVYHVQTEDKGLDSPLILSLVYVGGAILASKRTRYEDLIAEGFDEEVLTQRLKRQHRLICAAINAGRLEDLKRMGARPTEELVAPPGVVVEPPAELIVTEFIEAVEPIAPLQIETAAERPTFEDAPGADTAPIIAEEPSTEVEEPPTPGRSPRKESAYSVHDPRRQLVSDEVMGAESGLLLTILDDDEFLAGESYIIRVLLEDRSSGKEKALSGVGVSVKILGTVFRPQIYSVKTERDGVAAVAAMMPAFTSGRAAVLVRAVVKGRLIEVRRMIHPAE